ncbi:MAG: uncharacterized protein KVP18_004933 [Porospora cf. gigantea A]|uniref:uncharacterized protein n=1 Tax=Porospora cf. gigantea A TaxID=2853593 RepID=UPI003559865A|nr:MAG: hypothetical protein KVP18_004933 [Porospora cf. gigantea A]
MSPDDWASPEVLTSREVLRSEFHERVLQRQLREKFSRRYRKHLIWYLLSGIDPRPYTDTPVPPEVSELLDGVKQAIWKAEKLHELEHVNVVRPRASRGQVGSLILTRKEWLGQTEDLRPPRVKPPPGQATLNQFFRRLSSPPDD